MNRSRLIVTRRGCSHCAIAMKAIVFINARLPQDKQIEVMDNFEWEEFGFDSYPIISKILDVKTFDGYPYIYLDGIVVEPAMAVLLKITMAAILKEDLVLNVNLGGRIIGPSF